MGILPGALFRGGNAHIREDFQHAPPRFLPPQGLMQAQRLLNLAADGLQGVQAGHGILQHHGDFLAPDFQPFRLGAEFRQILAVIKNAAAVDPAVGVQQAHKCFCQHRFARAGFPHDGQRFALIQIQRYIPDGMQRFPAQGKFHVQIANRENSLSFLHGACLLYW